MPITARAAIDIVVQESGGNVVATATGSANTDDLTFATNTSGNSLIFGSSTGSSWWGAMYLGSGSQGDYYLIDTEINFSSGGVFNASSTSGTGWVGFVSGRGSTIDRLYLPTGYVSGQPLSATSTWNGASFASLGLITGTYEINWGSGPNADRLTLYIGTTPPVTDFSIGGAVNGASGALTLSLNNSESLVVSSNGDFEFSTRLEDGDSYAVAIESAPAGQFCSLANDSGTVSNANVSNVLVTCSNDPPPDRFDLFIGVNPTRIDTLSTTLNLLEIAVGNRGPDAAGSAVLTIDYGGGLGFDSLPGGCGPASANRIQCTLGDIGSGEQRLLTPGVRFLGPAPGNRLQLSVSAGGEDTSPADNTIEVAVVSRAPRADLRPAVSGLGLAGPDGPVVRGRTLRLSVGAENLGPDIARGVTTRTVLPRLWSVDQAAAGCSEINESGTRVLVCNHGDIPAPPLGGLPVGAALENTLIIGVNDTPLATTVSAASIDPNSSNDTSQLQLDIRSTSRDASLTAAPVSTVRLGQRDPVTFGFDLSLDRSNPGSERMHVEIQFPRAGIENLDTSRLRAEGFDCDTGRTTGTTYIFDCEILDSILAAFGGDIDFTARFTEPGSFTATASVTTSIGLDEVPFNDNATVQFDVEDTSPLEVLAIEVTQAVQNWENQVDLYKNKRTVVRVFVRDNESWPIGSAPENQGRLIASTGIAAPLPNRILEASTGRRAFFDPETPSRRNSSEVILEFLLPHNWTRVSDLRLSYEPTTYGRPVVCLEPDTSPDCEARVTFREPVRPRVTWFRTGYWMDDASYLEFRRTDSDSAPGGTFDLRIGSETIRGLPISGGTETIRQRVEAAAKRINPLVLRALVRPAERAPPGLFFDPADDNITGYFISLTTTRAGNDIADLQLLGVTPSSGSINGRIASLSDSGTFHQPTFAQLQEQRLRIRGLLPTDGFTGNVRVYPVTFDFRPSPPDVNTSMQRLRALEINAGAVIEDEHFYAAYLTGKPPAYSPSAGQSRGNVMSWYDSGDIGASELTVTDERDALGYARHRGAHEFYHALGKGHAGVVDRDEIEGDGLDPDTQRGVCNSRGRLGQTKHPYVERLPGVEFDTRVEGYDADEYPTLGPLNIGARRQIWGYATRFFGTGSELEVVDPFATSELMSYCTIDPDTKAALPNGSYSDHVRWPSSFSYLSAAIGLREGFTGAKNGTDFSGAILSVSGLLGVPFYGVQTFQGDLPAPDTGSTGSVNVTLLDANGQTVDSVDVSPILTFIPDIEGDEDPLTIPDQPDAFFALLRNPGGIGRTVIVREEGAEVGRVDASDNAPDVRLSSPIGGLIDSSGVLVQWQATDADGDELSADVLYSADDGSTWKVVGVGITTNYRFIPHTELAASNRGRIRVIVSDGFLATEVISPPLVVANVAPVVDILSDLPAILRDGLPLSLEAEAFDNEDGELDPANTRWRSSLQGALGTGSPLYLMPNTLQPGCHLLSAAVNDSAGARGIARAAVGVGTACEEEDLQATLRIRTIGGGDGPRGTSLLTSSEEQPEIELVAGVTRDIVLPPGGIELLAAEASNAAGGGYTCSDPSGNTATGGSPGLAQVSLDPGETVVCEVNLSALFAPPAAASTADLGSKPLAIPLLPHGLLLSLMMCLGLIGMVAARITRGGNEHR